MSNSHRLTDAAREAITGDLEPIGNTEEYRARKASNVNSPNLRGFRVAGGYVWIPEILLEPIAPPIPAEPEPGAYLIGDTVVVRPTRRDGDSRWMALADLDGDGAGYAWADSWADMWEQVGGGPEVTIRLLAPETEPVEPTEPTEPAEPAEPVTLPLMVSDVESQYAYRTLTVRAVTDSPGVVRVEARSEAQPDEPEAIVVLDLSANTADQVSRALTQPNRDGAAR